MSEPEGPNEDGRYTRTVIRVSVRVQTVHQQDIRGGWEDTDLDEVHWDRAVAETGALPIAQALAIALKHEASKITDGDDNFEEDF